MKITRRQLRKLIRESIKNLNEQEEVAGAAEEKAEAFDASDWASQLNDAMRGKADTDFIMSLFGAVIPRAFGGSAGTDEDYLMGLLSVIQSMKANENVAKYHKLLNAVAKEYSRLYDRNLREDILGELGSAELNVLEREAEGSKDWLRGKVKEEERREISETKKKKKKKSPAKDFQYPYAYGIGRRPDYEEDEDDAQLDAFVFGGDFGDGGGEGGGGE